MNKYILILGILASFNVHAEDNYQNCYGAANCMNFREYVKEYIEEHDLKSELDQNHDWEEGYDYNYNPNYFFSLSDDGKELIIYGPKEDGQSASVGYVSGEDWHRSWYDDGERDLFKNVESLKFEGNVSDLDYISLPSLKNLTIPDSVSTTKFFVVPSNVVDLTIGENVPIIIKTSGSASDELGGANLEEECPYSSVNHGFCNALREYLKTHPEYLTEDGLLTGEMWSIEIEYDHSILENMPTTIHCIGDLEKCKENMETAGYEGGSYQMVQAQPNSTNTEVKNADGSTTIFNEDGTIKGYKNKRIYTIDEANAVAGKVNSVKIRYR